MKKLKCTCGTCNVCKTRERMRELRAQKKGKPPGFGGSITGLQAAHDMEELSARGLQAPGIHGQQTEPKSRRKLSVPARAAPDIHGQQNPNNVAIWINGNDRHEYDGNLEAMIEERTQNFNREIQGLQDVIDRHHQKPKRNGLLYWYFWDNGTWRYCGREDPRPPIMAQKLELEGKAKEAERLMRSCVIKETGNHLVINVELFQKHVDKKLHPNMIRLSELLA